MNRPQPRPGIPLHRPKEPALRHALRLLGMVHELHKQGWQRLRVLPYMSPSGMHWRCELHPPEVDPVAWHAHDEDPGRTLCASYSSSTRNLYFDWSDATQDDARHLAAKFLERFPRLSQRSRGRDWAYAGWFAEVLGHAEHGRYPVAFWDLMEEEDRGFLWMGGAGGVPIPLGPSCGSSGPAAEPPLSF